VYGRQAADGVAKRAVERVPVSEEVSVTVGFKGGGDSGEAPLLAPLHARYVWRWIHKPPLIDTNLTQGGSREGPSSGTHAHLQFLADCTNAPTRHTGSPVDRCHDSIPARSRKGVPLGCSRPAARHSDFRTWVCKGPEFFWYTGVSCLSDCLSWRRWARRLRNRVGWHRY
jgi:hypothetical protein